MEASLDNLLCRAAQQLWTRGLLVGDQGLISAEQHRRRYLITPPGLRRCDLRPSELATVDIGGSAVNGQGTLGAPSWLPHRLAYQRRAQMPDSAGRNRPVAATILATPPMTLALLRKRADAMTLMLADLPPIAVVDQVEEDALRTVIETHQHVVIRSLGLFCFGVDLASTLNEIEMVEHAACVELAYEASS